MESPSQINSTLFQNLVEQSHDIVGLLDPQGMILYSSPSLKTVLGYEPAEVAGKNAISDLVHPDDMQFTQQKLGLLLQNPQQSQIAEFRLHHKDGSWRWVEGVGTNLLANPEVHAIVIQYHDITERKLEISQLKYSESQYRALAVELQQAKAQDDAILESIGDGLFATNKEGKIIFVNPAAAEMLRIQSQELIGQYFFEVIPAETEAGTRIANEDRLSFLTIKTGTRKSGAYYYVRKDHTRFPVTVTVSPIILDQTSVGSITAFRDMTEEKELEKTKTDFVSIASHQLRTPLTTVSWYTDTLLNSDTTGLSTKQKDYVREIYSANRRMTTLVNTLLNVSRIELGTLKIEPKPTRLENLANTAIQDLAYQIKTKQIQLSTRYDANLPPVNVDPKLISIVFQNLLSNAIKYSPKSGKVELFIRLRPPHVQIEVKDGGIGIPQPQQQKIFTKLFRGDNAREQDPEGSGLGLYVVKLIVELSNGKVWFESTEKKGTTFFVTIPLENIHDKEEEIV